jgi:hypothetical protein
MDDDPRIGPHGAILAFRMSLIGLKKDSLHMLNRSPAHKPANCLSRWCRNGQSRVCSTGSRDEGIGD